ncbi:MAG: hypothetical protein IJ083_11895 [Clostridia bacterium]|nr:hypothetical protein [Clostridia bacterium]
MDHNLPRYMDPEYLCMPRPPSRHPKMERGMRAKQFLPFSPLQGYEDMVRTKEEIQGLVKRPELSEETQDRLDRRLLNLEKRLREGLRPQVEIRYFEEVRTGLGHILEVKGTAKKLLLTDGLLYLDDQIIPLPSILSVRTARAAREK